MPRLKRAVFHASELVKREGRHRWYVCIGCYAVIDLGPEPPLHSTAPRCERCGDLGAPCNPDSDPRAARTHADRPAPRVAHRERARRAEGRLMAGPKKYDSELFAALHTVVAACRGRLSAGEDIAGTLRVEGLDIEVSLRIRPVVSNADRAKHVDAAMALLARDGFRDHCPCEVKNRSVWRIAKTKRCEGKVAVAIVRGIGGRFATAADVRFEFRCRAHADEAGPDLVAVVELPAAALKKLRAERQRARDERYAREHAELLGEAGKEAK